MKLALSHGKRIVEPSWNSPWTDSMRQGTEQGASRTMGDRAGQRRMKGEVKEQLATDILLS